MADRRLKYELVILGVIALIVFGWTRFADQPPVGVYIALLGVGAVLIALLPPSSRATTAVCIALAFGLGYLEIRNLYADREKHDKEMADSRQKELIHFQQIMQAFDQQRNLPSAEAAAVKRVARLKVSPPAPTPSGNLKRRAILLSSDIIEFLVERSAKEPPLPRPATWSADVDAMVKYADQTKLLFAERFEPALSNLHDELAEMHIRDPRLDALYRGPTNPLGMRMVAELLGALAEQIK